MIVLLLLPAALLAQEGRVSQADSYNRGVMAAEDEHSAIGWGIGGFVGGGLFSWLGTGITVLIAHGSSPSPRYVPEDVEPMSYRSGFREEARRRNRRSAVRSLGAQIAEIRRSHEPPPELSDVTVCRIYSPTRKAGGGNPARVARAEPLDHYTLRVFLGAVSWPNGQDIAPETLYSRATGEPLPDWMVSEEPT